MRNPDAINVDAGGEKVTFVWAHTQFATPGCFKLTSLLPDAKDEALRVKLREFELDAAISYYRYCVRNPERFFNGQGYTVT